MSIRDQVSKLKRDHILNAAISRFYEDGYEGTTIDKIAEMLSATKPFVYTYFKSKADILDTICQKVSRLLVDSVDAVKDVKEGPTEQLRRFVREYCERAITYRQYTAIFFREEKNISNAARKIIARERRYVLDGLVAVLNDGVKTGEFATRDVQALAFALIGMISWLHTWYDPAGRLSPGEVVACYEELSMKMVRPGV